MNRQSPYQRRAMTYVAVLGAAAIVSLIGLSALTTVRVRSRVAQGSTDAIEATFYAQSAIDMGMHMILSDPDWRSNNPNGYWKTNEPIGAGTYSVQGIDPTDAILDDSGTDPVELIGTGFKGAAQHTLRVELESTERALTCLETALHSGNDISLNGALVTGDQTISANNSIIGNNANVNVDVEAAATVSGGSFNQNVSDGASGVVARGMPDPTSVFNYYLTNGTTIPISSLPTQAAASQLSGVLLSPNSNPYGALNAEGIYVIDCLGVKINIESSRIVGTLVLLDPAPDSTLKGSLNWTPAVPNYPALMVQGSIDLVFNTAQLSENPLNTNFNPFGTPAANGEEDSSTDDSYPSEIAGLVYVSGSLTNSSNYPTIRGCAVSANTVTLNGEPKLYYDGTYLNNPPPGFTISGGVALVPQSWRRIVN